MNYLGYWRLPCAVLAKSPRQSSVWARNSLTMKKELFKSIKNTSNPAQAGDTTLAFYYDSVNVNEIEIVKDKRAPLDDQHFHGKNELTLWGPAVGFKEIPLLSTGTFNDSLMTLKFTAEGIKPYTHFIVNGVSTGSSSRKPSDWPFVTIYRLNDSDRHQIVTGYF
ncbi:MAG: hypothetical protein JWM20_587 [Patescibacteria group bacterium]|nr:hypothetical protein [Patescibacteria group bacterium]